jgi:hypothetical protein
MVSQRRYRRDDLSRIVKGIPAEMQTSWFIKNSKWYPKGDTDVMVYTRIVKGVPAEIQTSWFIKDSKGYPNGDTDVMVYQG